MIPPPDILGAYERVTPGLAERIVSMAEGQLKNSQRIDRMIARRPARGQWFAFLTVVLAIGAGTYLIATDKSLAGMAVVLSGLLPILGIFVYKETRHLPPTALPETTVVEFGKGER